MKEAMNDLELRITP